MSLALYASPINNDEPMNNSMNNNSMNNNNNIDKKRNIRKTIKNRSPPHVQKMIKTIYESFGDEENDIADFTPPPHAEQTKIPQNNYSSELLANKNLGISENSENDSSINKEAFNTLPSTYSNDYYKEYVPYYNQMSQTNGNKDQLLEKLNYMIHLLEEQQDVKTGHVMEEIILYSFLGVFMIFIVDSFARAAKYTR
jgi:hypothetical protein